MNRQHVYLLDASIYIFRSYFALPDRFFDSQERSVNAVYGYTQFLLNLLNTKRPSHIAAAFDMSLGTGFRHHLYPFYKMDRALADEQLAYQLEQCQHITRLLGISTFASAIFEADDLIATLLRKVERNGQRAMILSHDKDLTQLLTGSHQMWDVVNDRVLGTDEVIVQYGIHPTQIPDYLALVGDNIDGIPGVLGIGKKTAVPLILEFGTVENLIANVEILKQRSFRGKEQLCYVLEHTPYDVMLYKELATVCNRADQIKSHHTLEWQIPNTAVVEQFLDDMRFGKAIRNSWAKLVNHHEER
jgi:5'-3' exonuclease